MGTHAMITAEVFPRQGRWLHRFVDVCFHYDTSKIVQGRIVRMDDEEPGKMIIKLDDGRYVLSTECMYSLQPRQCASSPSGRHDVDTSMESGPRNCFHCGEKMP
jgi:hypothetical protein